MCWVNKNSGIKKFHSTNKKKQLGGSLRPPVAPLGGGLNPNMPAPPNVGVPNPYLEEGGELKKYQEGNEIPLPLKAMHEEQISKDRKKEFTDKKQKELLEKVEAAKRNALKIKKDRDRDSDIEEIVKQRMFKKLASEGNRLIQSTFLEKMRDKETDEE